MQDIPIDAKKRGPSSRLLQELIRQAPAEYVTVGWLTSHRHSFGIVMLCLGLLATAPVGSMLPGIDPPPLKWSDLRYVFDIQEDCNGKEAIQA
jgi:hypothetical protein